MKKIGDLLREKREERELTREQVSEETGMPLRYIEYLENSDFFSFRNKVYARSFLRDYGNYLSMDTFSMLEELENIYSEKNEETGKGLEVISDTETESEKETLPGEEVSLSEEKENTDEKNEPQNDIFDYEESEERFPIEVPQAKSFLGKTAGIFAVFIILCGCAYFIGKYMNPTDTGAEKNGTVIKTAQESANPDAMKKIEETSQSKNEKTDKTAETVPVQSDAIKEKGSDGETGEAEKVSADKEKTLSAVSGDAENTKVSSAAEKNSAPAGEKSAVNKKTPAETKPVGKDNKVTVYAFSELWIKADTDGKTVFQGIIPGGENREFSVKNDFKARIGDAGNCQINVNGKSVGKVGKAGQPCNFALSGKDFDR